ncbi:MAG: hypothetical protein ABI051_15300 [Vicinamibacterales bacterium]
MNKHLLRVALLAAIIGAPAATAAQDRNAQIQGFGGFTMRGISAAPTFGGNVAIPLTRNIQVVAEGGRLTDIMSPTLATLLDFTPVDLRLSALYGQAGVRFIGAPSSAVRPYAEATGGLARLRTGVDGLGLRTDAGFNTALRFLDRTAPMLGLGAGVVLQGGPVFVDLGYRFQQIRSDNALQSILSGGDLTVSQVRLGVGVRF